MNPPKNDKAAVRGLTQLPGANPTKNNNLPERETPEKRAERLKKLNEKQTFHRKLKLETETLYKEYKTAENRWRSHNKRLARIGRAIYDLKHNGQTPHVTDHAVVRYLERVKGVSIDDIKAEIANHKSAVREGGVIATVMTDEGEL